MPDGSDRPKLALDRGSMTPEHPLGHFKKETGGLASNVMIASCCALLEQNPIELHVEVRWPVPVKKKIPEAQVVWKAGTEDSISITKIGRKASSQFELIKR